MANYALVQSQQSAYTSHSGSRVISSKFETDEIAISDGYTYQVNLDYKSSLNTCAYISGYTAGSASTFFPPDYSYAYGTVKGYLYFKDGSSNVLQSTELFNISYPDSNQSSPNISDINTEVWIPVTINAVSPALTAVATIYMEVSTTLFTTISGSSFPALETDGVFIDIYGALDNVELLESATTVLNRKLYFSPELTSDGVFQIEEQPSVTSDPETGKQFIYPKTDGLWYTKDDAGVETQIGSGGTPAGGGDDTLVWLGW